MADIIDFSAKSKERDNKKEDYHLNNHATPAFWDEDVDPDDVYDVIENEEIRMAFVTMLLTLRQMSIDGESTITISEEGIRFDSLNSIETSPVYKGMQANTSIVKQGYLPLIDNAGKDVSPKKLSEAMGIILQALVLYKGTIHEDDD